MPHFSEPSVKPVQNCNHPLLSLTVLHVLFFPIAYIYMYTYYIHVHLCIYNRFPSLHPKFHDSKYFCLFCSLPHPQGFPGWPIGTRWAPSMYFSDELPCIILGTRGIQKFIRMTPVPPSPGNSWFSWGVWQLLICYKVRFLRLIESAYFLLDTFTEIKGRCLQEGSGFVAEPPGFTQVLLAWTNIIAFFLSNSIVLFLWALMFY